MRRLALSQAVDSITPVLEFDENVAIHEALSLRCGNNCD